MHLPTPLTTRRSRISALGLTVAGLIAAPLAVAAAGPTQSTGATSVATSHASAKPTVVLEAGAWETGSAWNGVVTRLQKAGYAVDVPPNPLRGVASDSAYLASYLDTITGPVVLVGHSYGGFVTTNAATGDKNVKALVYVDAFIPAKGDTVNSLTEKNPGSRIAPAALTFVPSAGGVTDAYIKPTDFRSILANDLSRKRAAELAATQSPIAASTLTDVSGTPAWTTIPSWALIGTEDHAIPPKTQEFMAHRAHAKVTTIKSSHLSLVSRPGAVTAVIEKAARQSS